VGADTPNTRELSGLEKLNAICRKEREQKNTRREAEEFQPLYLKLGTDRRPL